MTKNKNYIGRQLLRLRKKKDLTPEEVSNRLGYEGYHSLSMIENGHREVSNELLLRILTICLDLPYSQAQHIIGMWRIQEIAEKFDIKNVTINAKGQVIHNEGEMTLNMGDININ